MHQRAEDEISTTAGEFLASDADVSLELPASVSRSQDESDVKMSAVLVQAPASLGWRALYCLPRSAHIGILGTWIQSAVATAFSLDTLFPRSLQRA